MSYHKNYVCVCVCVCMCVRTVMEKNTIPIISTHHSLLCLYHTHHFYPSFTTVLIPYPSFPSIIHYCAYTIPIISTHSLLCLYHTHPSFTTMLIPYPSFHFHPSFTLSAVLVIKRVLIRILVMKIIKSK